MKFPLISTLLAGMLLPSLTWGLEVLSDHELSMATGQSLLTLNYIAPSGSGTGATTSDYGFYTLGVQGLLSLNLNARALKLGCDGANATGACDLDLSNVSFGCVANASNQCIPVSGTNTNSGVASTESRTNMRDFVLTNPFIQIAIKNPTTAATREFVGVRLGAEKSEGPLSFGTINSFSGYLNATLELQALGQTNIGVTCGDSTAPCRGASLNGLDGGDGSNDFALDGLNTLGLDDECALRVIFCTARFSQLTVDYGTATRSGAPIVINGRRQTQAMISNINFGKNTVGGRVGIVQQITDSLTVNQTSNALGAGLINSLLPLLKSSVADKIITQLAAGLGTTATALNDDTYVLPYNLVNFHEAEVNSTLFGLSVQKASVLYPGYQQATNIGWGLYLPNAFTLNITDPTTLLVQNIVDGDAQNGNITQLQPANVNCYGSLTFC